MALFTINDTEFVVGGPVTINSLSLSLPADMSNVRVAVDVRNVMLNALRDKIDAGAGAGTVKFYSGAQPASGDDPPAGVLLATVTCSLQSAPDAASGSLTFNPFTGANVVSNGTAVWARIEDSDGNNVLDGDVAEA